MVVNIIVHLKKKNMIRNEIKILVLLTLLTTSSTCGIFREYFVSKIFINIYIFVSEH